MAAVFGTEPAVATFLVAFRLSHLSRRLFGEGALQSAFIPQFEKLRQIDAARAWDFFYALRAALALFLLLFIAILTFLGWSTLQANLFPEQTELITLTIFLLPSLLFICLAGLNASVLQCEKRFFLPGVAPVGFNAGWIASLLYIAYWLPYNGLRVMCCGVTLGTMIQWAITEYPIRAQLPKKTSKKSFWNNEELRQLLVPLCLAMCGVAATQVNSAIDMLFAQWNDPAGPAALWYAIRLQQLPLSLFGVALSSAILPPLARALKEQDLERYCTLLSSGIEKTLLLTVPLTGCLFLYGQDAIELLFFRGEFTTSSVISTTYCLWGYAAGLVPMSLVLILAPALYAKHLFHYPALLSGAVTLFNIALNSIFVFALGWEAWSVALATAVASWTQVGFLIRYFRKAQISPLPPRCVARALLLGTSGSAIALCFTLATRSFFADILPHNLSTLCLLGVSISLLFVPTVLFLSKRK